MDIKIIYPSEALKAYVKCYWAFSHHGHPHTERLFPVGEPQMIFHLGTPFIESELTSCQSRQPRTVVCGQLSSYKNVTVLNNSELFGISLQPYALNTFVQIPAWELTDRSTDLTAINKEWV